MSDRFVFYGRSLQKEKKTPIQDLLVVIFLRQSLLTILFKPYDYL